MDLKLWSVFKWLDEDKHWMFINAFSDVDELEEYLFENEHEIHEVVSTTIPMPKYMPADETDNRGMP